MTITPVKRALLSVADKSGLVELAQALARLQIEIVSTGGTSKLLKSAGIAHSQVEDLTGFPEMMNGRLKTLHPKVMGGILGRRDEHAADAAQHQIGWIDLVVVNFYPFADALKKNPEMGFDEAIEYIDVGGPSMVRAAAKNFAWVGVVTDPADYGALITELNEKSGLSLEMKRNLAEKVFALTAQYDATIHHYFSEKNAKAEDCPAHLSLHWEKQIDLRYGENPHQKACAYKGMDADGTGILSAKQHQGKSLSYNNILDAEAALTCCREFDAPACVIVKHANPCGVAVAANIDEAFARAYAADSLSAFGGIIALNRPCSKNIAESLMQIFMEVIIAPSYSDEALQLFATKPNLRVLELPIGKPGSWEMKFITGGLLLQEKDQQVITPSDLSIVTTVQPSADQINALLFAWRVLKHIKSNAILIAKNEVTLGIGAGQVSRVDSVDIAIRKAGANIRDAVLASDAFFPFRDSIDRIGQTGVRAIIQPGGSVRDPDVIAACNEHNIAMVFTGKRCFRH